jgi:hypothetical protein
MLNFIDGARGDVDWVYEFQEVVSCCEHGDEHSNYMKCGECHDRLNDMNFSKLCFEWLIKLLFGRSNILCVCLLTAATAD